MSKRRLPRPTELAQLLRPKPIVLNPTDRRLAGAHTIADLRTVARSRTPRAVFDYTDGAAELEDSLRRARQAYRAVEFRPNVLRGVSDVDTSVEVLGTRSELPFAFAPTGFTRMMHHEGERAVARVAQRSGIPYSLSTMGTTSIEDVAAAAPQARKWFQLYVWRDHGAGAELMRRAWESGYDTLMLTVDTPVGGSRLRDLRNGLTIPPALTLRTFVDGAVHPTWWLNLLTTEPLAFASLKTWGGTVEELINRIFDPTLDYDDLAWVREKWPGKLVVKAYRIQSTRVMWSRRARRPCCFPTMAGGSWTGRQHPWSCCGRPWTSSEGTPRCGSTPAFSAVATSWRPRPWALIFA